jgi:muramoyltetrapeptide carboxypeptidase
VRWLEEAGYPVRCGENLRAQRGYLAGSDDTRLLDFRSLIRDPEVGAILFARGGYGVARILRDLDPEELRASQKLFVGYSDATALLLFLREQVGLASVHGPMLDRTDTTPAARERLFALLRGERVDPLDGKAEGAGLARGPLVGGNLTLIAASLGTPSEIDTRGAILFFEEVGEEPYRLDRSLVQLRDAGKLSEVAGVAVGQLVRCRGERYPQPSPEEVVREVLLPEVSGPVVVDLPFGHLADNRALGIGIEAELNGDTGTLALLGSVVEENG